MYTVPYLKCQLATTQKSSASKLEIYSDRANCFGSLRRLQDSHVMLSPSSQHLYSTVLNEKSNGLLLIYTLLENRNLLCCCVYSTEHRKIRSSCSQLHCIKFNIPRTNFSIKSTTGKKRVATEPDQINSILERLRCDQTGCCLSSPSSKG